MSNIEPTITNVSSEMITCVFLALIIGILIFSFYQGRKGSNHKFLDYAPTLMTTLGILGTFTGVVVGLLHFNTNDLDSSIPALLDGLKSAFITSISGMMAAIIFNILDVVIFQTKRKEKHKTSSTLIHEVLLNQHESLTDIRNATDTESEHSIQRQLMMLRAELKGYNDSSIETTINFQNKMLSELDKHNSDKIKREKASQDQLSSDLKQYSQNISDSAKGEIIRSLENIVVNFNDNLKSQFGENFKSLDAAVKDMVIWQEHYKNHVTTMEDKYSRYVDALESVTDCISDISDECKEIPIVVTELANVININQHQIAELQRHLDAFVALREQAITAIPTIKHKMIEVGDVLSDGSNKLQKNLEATAQLLMNSNTVLQGKIADTADQLDTNNAQLQAKVIATVGHLDNGNAQLQAKIFAAVDRLDTGSVQAQARADDIAKQMADSAGLAQIALTNSTSELQQNAKNIVNDFSSALGKLSHSLSDDLTKLGSIWDEKIGLMTNTTLKIMSQLNMDITTRLDSFVKLSAEHTKKQFELIDAKVDSLDLNYQPIFDKLHEAIIELNASVNKIQHSNVDTKHTVATQQESQPVDVF